MQPEPPAGDRDLHGLAARRVRRARAARRRGARAAQRRRRDHRRRDPLARGVPAAPRDARGDADPPHRLRHVEADRRRLPQRARSRRPGSRRRSRSSPSPTSTPTCASRSCACAARRSCSIATRCAASSTTSTRTACARSTCPPRLSRSRPRRRPAARPAGSASSAGAGERGASTIAPIVGPERSAPLHRLGDRGGRVYRPRTSTGAAPGAPGRVPLHARHPPARCTAARPWTMRQYAGYASARGVKRPLPLPAGERGSTGLSMAFDLPTQLGLDSDDPRCARRGRAHRRRDRHDRRHAHRVRRDPARHRLDLDDDQRPRRRAAVPLRAGRRGAGRRAGDAARHEPERHPQGVHRPRQLHLPARARRCG